MILSIQSSVASGHVGNEAAVLPLQRLGFEVSAVPTVMLSNHPARGEAAGEVLAPGRVGALIGGIEKLGRFGDCRAVLSGYVGAAGTPDVVRGAVARVRAANPAAIYCCDPVMAHEGRGFFVEPPVRAAINDALVPVADIVTPNAVELAYLTGRPVAGLDDALSAAALVRTRGPRLVVVTSLSVSGPAGPLITVAAGDDGAWAIETPRLGGGTEVS